MPALKKSDFPATEALKLLQPLGVDAAILSPTETGMRKSIIDATDGFRDYLRETGYHDYKTQPLGQEGVVTRTGFLVKSDEIVPTKVSMYRPATKNGDPRVWLGAALRKYAAPLNTLAVTVIDGEMYVLNMSDPAVRDSLDDENSPFRVLISKNFAPPSDIDVSAELLSQKLPLAESLVQDPISGVFDVIPKPPPKGALLSSALGQVSDAVQDCLAGSSNGLNEKSLIVIRLLRTLSKYSNDPQRVEMDFTTIHSELVRQVAVEELPPSAEVNFLIDSLQQAAQSIRALDQEVYRNRKLLQSQAMRELSDEDLGKIADAGPVLYKITDGDLNEQLREDVSVITEVRKDRPNSPQLTRQEAGSDETVRVMGRASRIFLAVRNSPTAIHKLSESTAVKAIELINLLTELIKVGISLF